jgi:hypothetical protein
VIDEVQAYIESLDERFELLIKGVRGLGADDLNFRPSFDGANSIWVLATHTIGNARAWILGIVCGRERRRDRPAEFASSGDDPDALVAAIDEARNEVLGALRELDGSRLDLRLTPPQELWGEGPPRELSIRDAIIQVIEHASLHVGHMDVVRSLALGQR